MTLRAAALSVLVPAASAWAQQPTPSPSPSPAAIASEYVEVTAKGIQEDIQTVPASVTVVSGSEMADRGAHDLRTALALTAGIDVAPGGDEGPAGAVPEFWGLKEFDAFLLVSDGVPWGGAFNPSLTTLSLEDVDRIEVQRGAAPVMFGATSFVGVMHVVHKDAASGDRSAHVFGGSRESFGASYAGPLGHWAGFDSRLAVDGAKIGFKPLRSHFERGHLLWRNGRTVGDGRFRFDVDGVLLNQDPYSPHPREGQELSAAVPLDANHNPDGAFMNDRRVQVNLAYDKPVGSATWSSEASFAHTSHDMLRGFLQTIEEAPDNAHGLREKIDLNDLYLDTHLAWKTDKDFKLVVGADYLLGKGDAEGHDFDYTVDLAGLHPEGIASDENAGGEQVGIKDTRNFGGLYSFVEWNPTARVRLEGGLRLNHTKEEREGEEEGNAAPSPEEEALHEQEVTRLSGTAGLTVTAWESGKDAVHVFAQYRDSFKPAAFDFGIGEGEEGGGEEEGLLDPETARSYELGVKGRFGDRMWFEVASFLMDFDNLVIATTVGGLPALQNAGQERFKGIDTTLGVRLGDHLTWRTGYGLHDARFTDFVFEFDPGVPTRLDDKRLEMSPHHIFATGLTYAPARGLFGSADLHYVGSRWLNKRNTALADGYADIAASLGWRNARWEVRADARNLTDERPPVAESELGDAQYYRLPAFRIDGAVTLRF